MRIEIKILSQYGVKRKFVVDSFLADYIHTLTGKETLSDEHITALKALGHEIWLVEIQGEKVKPLQY